MKKLLLFTVLILSFFSTSFAENPSFIDFTKVLNQSKAGGAAQEYLKKKFEDESKKFKIQGDEIKKKEKEIISQKKLITQEEYKKKVVELRKKVAKLQESKANSLKNLSKSRTDAKNKLLKAVNPIVKKYMKDNNIRLVIDKSSVLMGDSTLEITDQIIAILNKNLSSIDIK
jgi:outer membrane protein